MPVIGTAAAAASRRRLLKSIAAINTISASTATSSGQFSSAQMLKTTHGDVAAAAFSDATRAACSAAVRAACASRRSCCMRSTMRDSSATRRCNTAVSTSTARVSSRSDGAGGTGLPGAACAAASTALRETCNRGCCADCEERGATGAGTEAVAFGRCPSAAGFTVRGATATRLRGAA